MITPDEARDIAIAFVNKSDQKQCSARYAEVRDDGRYPTEWLVVFDLYSKDGDLLDSPFVVSVDKETKKVQFG